MRAIWAATIHGVTRVDNILPWNLPEDVSKFNTLTRNHTVVMDASTWSLFPEGTRTLSGRKNIIVSSQHPGGWSQGAEVINDINRVPDNCWVIGGGIICGALMPKITHIWITLIDDANFFPLGNHISRSPRIPPGFMMTQNSEWKYSDTGYWAKNPDTKGIRYKDILLERS